MSNTNVKNASGSKLEESVINPSVQIQTVSTPGAGTTPGANTVTGASTTPTTTPAASGVSGIQAHYAGQKQAVNDAYGVTVGAAKSQYNSTVGAAKGRLESDLDYAGRLYERMKKYLPQQQRAAGMSGMGITQTALTRIDSAHHNTRAGYQRVYDDAVNAAGQLYNQTVASAEASRISGLSELSEQEYNALKAQEDKAEAKAKEAQDLANYALDEALAALQNGEISYEGFMEVYNHWLPNADPTYAEGVKTRANGIYSKQGADKEAAQAEEDRAFANDSVWEALAALQEGMITWEDYNEIVAIHEPDADPAVVQSANRYANGIYSKQGSDKEAAQADEATAIANDGMKYALEAFGNGEITPEEFWDIYNHWLPNADPATAENVKYYGELYTDKRNKKDIEDATTEAWEEFRSMRDENAPKEKLETLYEAAATIGMGEAELKELRAEIDKLYATPAWQAAQVAYKETQEAQDKVYEQVLQEDAWEQTATAAGYDDPTKYVQAFLNEETAIKGSDGGKYVKSSVVAKQDTWLPITKNDTVVSERYVSHAIEEEASRITKALDKKHENNGTTIPNGTVIQATAYGVTIPYMYLDGKWYTVKKKEVQGPPIPSDTTQSGSSSGSGKMGIAYGYGMNHAQATVR